MCTRAHGWHQGSACCAEQLALSPGLLCKAGMLTGRVHACARSLVETGDAAIANGRLLDTIRQVQCFGLGMMTLDVRQESSRHSAALSAITDYLGLGLYECAPLLPHPCLYFMACIGIVPFRLAPVFLSWPVLVLVGAGQGSKSGPHVVGS